ncbi:MAG: hypothetical protein R2690_05725 [Acidimicrobiales bacterium]
MLAQVELFHSRPVAPTRRVALGDVVLPVDPSPGFGGVLLAGMVALGIPAIDPDAIPDVVVLTHDVEEGRRIPQPCLRHRLQTDRVGLQRSVARLVGAGDTVAFDVAEVRAAPEQLVLAAIYAARRIAPGPRRHVLHSVRRAIGWVGPLGPDFVAAVSGSAVAGGLGPDIGVDPIAWALDVLGLDRDTVARLRAEEAAVDEPEPVVGGVPERLVRKQFRVLLRQAHPDHGGAERSAAARIAELTEARRLLTGA